MSLIVNLCNGAVAPHVLVADGCRSWQVSDGIRQPIYRDKMVQAGD